MTVATEPIDEALVELVDLPLGNGFRNPETPRDRTLIPESGNELKGRYELPFTTLSAAVKNVPPEPDFIWHGLIAAGAVTLLGAKPKCGKTTLAFGLLHALEHGTPFLGFATSKTKAVMLTEERPATLAEKFERWQVDPIVLMRHSIDDRPWHEVMAEAVAVAHAEEARLLIVDTLAEWTSLAGDSENASGAVIEQLRPLQNAAASGLGVLAAHHLRKGNGDGWDSFRGSGAFQAAVDILVRIERKGEEFRELHADGRFAAIPKAVTYELDEDGAFQVATIERERDRILAALEVAGSARREQIAEEVELTPRAVGGHLEAMHAAGKIGRTGRGVKGDPHVFHSDSGTTDDPLGASGFRNDQIALTEAA